MRCAACGYYSVPGSTSCARCGRATEAAPPTFAEVYPPRARSRPAWDRAMERLAGRVAAIQDRVPIAELHGETREVGSIARQLSTGVISLLPGLGQLFQRRFIAASSLAAGALALGALAFHWLHHWVSDFLLFLLFVLIWVSVFDALRAGALIAFRKEDWLRSFRYVLAALGIVSGSATACGLALMPWYSFWQMATSPPGLPFRAGDGMIIRRETKPATIGRGDALIFRDENGRETVGIVRAGPGETIPGNAAPGGEPSGDTGGDSAALGLRRGAVTAVVPHDELAVTVPASWGGRDTRTIALVRSGELEGRIMAIYTPPERRRWLR